ncbi:MAG: iron ABC transporter permease [Pseudomonadota bacterium]
MSVTGPEFFDVFYHFELPRLLLSLIVGCTLALTGVMTQSLFHNPLAEPGVLGISSGASLFSLLGLLVFPVAWQQATVLGVLSGAGAAVVASLLMLLLQRKRLPVVHLLLTGVLINAFCGGIIQLMTLLMEGERLRGWLFWSSGQLGNASWMQVSVLALLTSCVALVLWKKSEALDALLLGEEVAYSIGVDPKVLQRFVLLGAAILVAACLMVCGQIAFIGLMAPHLARLWKGAAHKRLIPVSMMLGGALVCIADLLCQHLLVGSELPVGTLTTLMGVPVLLHALISQKRGF